MAIRLRGLAGTSPNEFVVFQIKIVTNVGKV